MQTLIRPTAFAVIPITAMTPNRTINILFSLYKGVTGAIGVPRGGQQGA